LAGAGPLARRIHQAALIQVKETSLDINAEAEVNTSSQDQSPRIAPGMLDSVAELLGQQSAEIAAHVNRWSEELIRYIKTSGTDGGLAAAPSAPKSANQMCPLCGCMAFAWREERAALCCVQCASTGRSRLLALIIERSGLLKRGVCVLDLTPEPGMAQRIQHLAADYRRPGPQEGAETAHIDCAELCARSPSAYLRARFDLLLHMHLLHPGAGNLASALQNLSACLKDTGHMLFTIPIKVAPAAADGQAGKISDGYDGNDVKRLLRSQFGNRLAIAEPRDYLTPQDLEFYRIHLADGLSSDTVFVIAGS
jgi:hypothetical protein